MSNFQPIRSVTSRNDERDDSRKAHGWVFPPNPVTTGLLIGITDALAAELIEIIRSDCTDEGGHMISEGSAAGTEPCPEGCEQDNAKGQDRLKEELVKCRK